MYCSNCGAETQREGVQFCGACGSRLSVPEVAVAPPTSPQPATRRVPVWLLVLVPLVVLAGVVGVFATKSSPEEEVRDLVLRQFALFNEGSWSELYQTYAPRVRETCTPEEFRVAASEAFTGMRVRVSDVNVRVAGDTAYVTYTARYTLSDGSNVTVGATPDDPDIYVRQGGRWLDEADAYTSLVCS